MMITDLYCSKAQYKPASTVSLCIEGYADGEKEVEISVKNLNTEVLLIVQKLSFESNEKYVVELGCFDIGGYGIDVCVEGQIYQTAFDVANDVRDYPRYGFLSDFSNTDFDEEDVVQLSKYHINTVQFYDWMYRHHDLIPETTEFVDALGRHLNIDAVRHKITACRKFNMVSIGYAAIYGSEKEYASIHPEQIMYRGDGKPFDLIGFIYMMNYDVHGAWSDHIIDEFKKALDFGFDGLHLDQYGYPKFAYGYQNNEIFAAEDAFAPFINKVRERVDAHWSIRDEKPILYFNSVNNWPVYKVADTNVNAVYIEVWNPFDSYFHLSKIIQEAKRYGNNKPVILAAYLKPFSKKENVPVEMAQQCFKLVTAAIYANGGFHLVLGEKNAFLQDAYYAEYGVFDDVFAKTVRKYYDFIVRYRDLIHDYELENVSMNYSGGIIGDYYIENVPVSSDARPGTVWINVRKKKGRKVIDLINLTNQTDSIWNKGKVPVQALENITLILLNEPAETIFMMSPDSENISMREIELCEVPHFCGTAYRVDIPVLDTWTTLVINEK